MINNQDYRILKLRRFPILFLCRLKPGISISRAFYNNRSSYIPICILDKGLNPIIVVNDCTYEEMDFEFLKTVTREYISKFEEADCSYCGSYIGYLVFRNVKKIDKNSQNLFISYLESSDISELFRRSIFMFITSVENLTRENQVRILKLCESSDLGKEYLINFAANPCILVKIQKHIYNNYPLRHYDLVKNINLSIKLRRKFAKSKSFHILQMLSSHELDSKTTELLLKNPNLHSINTLSFMFNCCKHGKLKELSEIYNTNNMVSDFLSRISLSDSSITKNNLQLFYVSYSDDELDIIFRIKRN